MMNDFKANIMDPLVFYVLIHSGWFNFPYETMYRSNPICIYLRMQQAAGVLLFSFGIFQLSQYVSNSILWLFDVKMNV